MSRERAEGQQGQHGSIYLVFEYMDHDLTGLVEQPLFRPFALEHIKCYLKQLLDGLHFCHRNNVLHRPFYAAVRRRTTRPA